MLNSRITRTIQHLTYNASHAKKSDSLIDNVSTEQYDTPTGECLHVWVLLQPTPDVPRGMVTRTFFSPKQAFQHYGPLNAMPFMSLINVIIAGEGVSASASVAMPNNVRMDAINDNTCDDQVGMRAIDKSTFDASSTFTVYIISRGFANIQLLSRRCAAANDTDIAGGRPWKRPPKFRQH